MTKTAKKVVENMIPEITRHIYYLSYTVAAVMTSVLDQMTEGVKKQKWIVSKTKDKLCS